MCTHVVNGKMISVETIRREWGGGIIKENGEVGEFKYV
jgi:hypothetical protein